VRGTPALPALFGRLSSVTGLAGTERAGLLWEPIAACCFWARSKNWASTP